MLIFTIAVVVGVSIFFPSLAIAQPAFKADLDWVNEFPDDANVAVWVLFFDDKEQFLDEVQMSYEGHFGSVSTYRVVTTPPTEAYAWGVFILSEYDWEPGDLQLDGDPVNFISTNEIDNEFTIIAE